MTSKEVVRLQAYIREPSLKNAVRDLQQIYGDNEMLREAVRCLAKREGVLTIPHLHLRKEAPA